MAETKPRGPGLRFNRPTRCVENPTPSVELPVGSRRCFNKQVDDMKISRSQRFRRHLQITGMAWLSLAMGSCSAGAETFQHGGSTAIIEQSGGSGTSRSEVSRYSDGQRIVTQDGSNMDVTIQGSGVTPEPGDVGSYPPFDADRFSHGSFDQRRPPSEAEVRTGADCAGCTPSRLREAFRQEMLERMGGDFR